MKRLLAALFTLLLAGLSAATPAAAAPSTQSARCFTETNQCIDGRIREFWEQNGGLSVFGFPISDASPFNSGTGDPTRVVQYFERTRLELHPENARPYDVLLGRLGVDDLQYYCEEHKGGDNNEAELCGGFTDGIQISDKFQTFYSTHGLEFDGKRGKSYQESLALFGLPISAPTVVLVEGKPVLTQWFERARFEYHPENAGTQYEVLLGRLGASVYAS